MTAAATLVALLLAAPVKPGKEKSPPVKEQAEGSKLEQGQRFFVLGEFEAALKVLDAAALEEKDLSALEQIHLLRAQCASARQDFVRAEEAFALALDANPDTVLDPAKVDPTVVKMLEAVKGRLTGTLVVASTPDGADLFLDGKPAGLAPRTLTVPVGKHKLEARWGDLPATGTEVQLRPRREVRVQWVQGPSRTVEVEVGPKGRPVSPYGDFRFAPEFSITPMVAPTLPLELTGGVEFSFFRVGLSARVFPGFGLTPRFAFALPVLAWLSVVLELAAPFQFFPNVLIGVAGAAGAEFYPTKFFAAFVEVGARHYFVRPGNDATALVTTAGVRLRMP